MSLSYQPSTRSLSRLLTTVHRAQIVALEHDLHMYLRELLLLPFYPNSPRDCAGDKALFCKTMYG